MRHAADSPDAGLPDAGLPDAGLAELRRLGGPVLAALERSGMAVVVTDPRQADNPLIAVNAAFTRLTGYEPHEALGRNCRFLQGPDTDAATIATMHRMLRGSGELEVDVLNRRKDGTPFWNRLCVTPIRDEAGQPRFFLATQYDTTAEREGEAQRRELDRTNESLRRALAASGAAAAWEWRVNENRIIGDAHFAALHGVAAEEAVAGLRPDRFFAAIHPDDRPRIRLAVGAVLRGAEVFSREWRLLQLGGTVRWVHGRGRCHRDAAGEPVRFAGVLVDVTEQKRAEERLRVAQTAGGIGAFEYLAGFATASVSDQFCRLLGLQPADDLPVRTINGVVLPGDAPVVGPAVCAAPGPVPPMEFRITRPDDGEQRWLARHGECLRDAETAALRFSGVIYDVTEAKRTEERLRTLNETLEAQVEERTRERDRTWRVAPVMMAVVALDGTVLMVNPAWTAVLGWTAEETVGRSALDFMAPEDHGASRDRFARLNRGMPVSDQNVMLTPTGSRRRIAWTRVPEGGHVYAYGRDVTDQLATEEQLRQAQKMEAVGQLTGGLAHDFNNLLTGITGSLELIEARVAQGRLNTLPRYIAAAQGAASRAAALTHRLLAFSRRQTLDPKPTNANRLVSGMEELVRRTVGPAIRLDTVLAIGLWPTLCDPNQLENAILNLCINARDAMPDGGHLTIETANCWLDERGARERDMMPGEYVAVCVSDTGTGMTPDVIARAFDPFFTTKPLGEGTGLGLSMIYGFARQSGGQVRIYSEPGQGTTMRLYLPRHWGDAAEEAAAGRGEIPRSEQGETVLVVDDEPTVRMLVTEVLEELGYATVEAADGASALKLLESDARIDLLITDVGLPGGLNGRQLADAARNVARRTAAPGRPALRVLFITGYAENAAVGNGHLEPGMHVLTKPFAMDTLGARVKAILSGP